MQARGRRHLRFRDVDAHPLCSRLPRLVHSHPLTTSRHHLDLPLLLEAATALSHLAMGAVPAMPRTNETTSSTSPIPSARHPTAPKAADSKNTRLPSSVLYARNASLEHTTFALTSEHIPMSDHSCAQCVERRSLANTIENAMRVCTPVKRNLCAAVLCKARQIGAVDADSLVLTHWVVTSDQKLGACASSLCSMKKQPRDRRLGWKNNSKPKSLQA